MNPTQLDWLQNYQSDQPHFGLERIEKLLALRGNPHHQVPVIHIAGTNGKGSTAATLSQLLQEKGLVIGSFSSPYIIDYCEQISINGKPIAKEKLDQLAQDYRSCLERQESSQDFLGLTEFEIVTALAFDYFAQEKVDLAIMEVGMGGLLDSTNVCQPVLTAITTIGLDHVALLGDTLAKIAEQKAGIIKETIPVITGNLPLEAYQVIEQRAQEKESPHQSYQKDYQVQWSQSLADGETFFYSSHLRPKTSLKTRLLGKHQVENASLALALADTYCFEHNLPLLNTQEVQRALTKTFWPARMEIICQEPLILLDGAHNPHAMTRLVDNISERYANFQKDILFSCIRTKELTTMVQQLKSLDYQTFTLTSFEDQRAFSKAELEQLAHDEDLAYQNWQDFLTTYLKEKPEPRRILIVTGSLYFLSQVRQFLTSRPNTTLGESHGY